MDEISGSVLLIDDDGEALVSLSRALKGAGLETTIEATSSVDKALSLFKENRPESIVLDLSLNEREGVHSGFAMLAQILAIDSSCRVIVLTGHASREYGIESLRRGAAHFLEKPADISHLVVLIRDGIAQARLRRELEAIRNQKPNNCAQVLLGNSDSIKKVHEAVAYAAQTSQPVLISGETGTGKGLCASAIHQLGNRSQYRFVRYQPNFSNSDLVNSDLFGHLKGAFTGAFEDRRGLLSEAHQGTLFLDEIDELPMESQVTLLGVLQDKKFRPLGSNREIETNARFITATNRDVRECVESGKLRKDLFHRVAHFTINIPALRERREDIGILARAFLERICSQEQLHIFDIEPAAIQRLREFQWPGNVRELEAVVQGAASLAQYRGRTVVTADDILVGAPGSNGNSPSLGFHEQVERFKLSLVKEALATHSGNQVRAAEQLGLDRSSLRRLLARDNSDSSS